MTIVPIYITLILTILTVTKGNLLLQIQNQKLQILGLTKKLFDSEKRIQVLEFVIGNLARDNQSSVNSDLLQLKQRQKGHISFSAYKVRTQSGLNKRHVIKFEKVILNIGDHYHPEDGIFIAPVRGIYMFHWTINTYSDMAYTNILVGGKVMSTTTTSYEPSYYGTGSAMIIVEVNKEEHVWIQTCCDTSNDVRGSTLGLDDLTQSTFSGTLLYKN